MGVDIPSQCALRTTGGLCADCPSAIRRRAQCHCQCLLRLEPMSPAHNLGSHTAPATLASTCSQYCSAGASKPTLGITSHMHQVRYRTGSYRGDALLLATY